ncbi:multidrug ABC transporter permease [Actinoplanes sp. NBRC 101535]|nr:multidrug ABC transporter permease [Actinoplanes sp. NBRC 101535]
MADPGRPVDRSAARYLCWLVRRSRLTTAAAVGLAVTWMGFQAMVPAIVGQAIDAAAQRRGTALLGWGLILLFVGVAHALAGIARHRFAVANWLGASFRTVQVTVRHANLLGATLPRRLDAGEVVAIGTSDLTHIGGAIDIAARSLGGLIAIVTVTVLLLHVSVPLGLVVLLGVPVLLLVAGALIRPLHRQQEAYRRQQGRLTGNAADLVAGLHVIRGVGGEQAMADRYATESRALRDAGVRTARVEALLEAAQVLLPGIFLVLVTWLGARFALQQRITVGEMVSFYAYAAFLVAPMRQLTEAIDKLTRGHVSAQRVVTMLGVRTDLPDPAAPVPLPRGELADPESRVVIAAGRLTAIAAADPVDAARVADRLGRYADGATLDGLPLAAAALSEVRRRILVVENEARLFSGRLRSDLDPAGDGALPEALEAAAATEIVEALPAGVQTRVAERGRSFSGGQQQRLRLARALLADPEIMILVEPTNAVDPHTEELIAERLRAARAGRTTVICTSSPLVLNRTDHVFYLEQGRVVASGTHHDLLVAEPRYAAMVSRGDLP